MRKGQIGRGQERRKEERGAKEAESLDNGDEKQEAEKDGPDLRQGERVQGDSDGRESDR